MIDLALEYKIIAKSGSWFSYRDERAQGRDSMRIILKENAKLLAHLEQDVKKKLAEIAAQPATSSNAAPVEAEVEAQ
jgi:recombination protein RecA